MKIGELIQRVQSLYSMGVSTQNVNLHPRHIYNILLSNRSLLMTLKLKKYQRISEWCYQTISCIEIIKVNSTESCSCIPALDNCYIYRTKNKIPKPLMFYNKDCISKVTSIDGFKTYTRTSSNKQDNVGRRYSKNSNTTQYYIHNDFIYFRGKHIPKYISITGLFEDPEEVDNFQTCNKDENEIDNKCIDVLNKEFLIDDDLITPLIEMTKKELQEFFTKSKKDITNDAQENYR